MNYLLTGASGFLGKYIYQTLIQKGKVLTIGRSAESDIQADFQKEVPKIPEVDMVVHAAGAAHFLPKTEQEKQYFFDVNVKGTKKILKQLSENKTLPSTFVFISSVSVYGKDFGKLIDEKSKLLGQTPYALSKIQAEKLILEWGMKTGVKVFILRLPLVVGENPPGNLGAMEKAIKKGYYFRVGNGECRKSMVLAEDVAKLISELPNLKSGIYNLTDGINPKISDLDTVLSLKYEKNIKVIPLGLVKVLAKVGDKLNFFPLNSYRLEKLTGELTFDCSKATKHLNWNPNPVLTRLSS